MSYESKDETNMISHIEHDRSNMWHVLRCEKLMALLGLLDLMVAFDGDEDEGEDINQDKDEDDEPGLLPFPPLNKNNN